MFAPVIDFCVPCAKCGNELAPKEWYSVTYRYAKTSEEVVIHRCEKCKTKLIVPLRSKSVCYKFKFSDRKKLSPVLH